VHGQQVGFTDWLTGIDGPTGEMAGKAFLQLVPGTAILAAVEGVHLFEAEEVDVVIRRVDKPGLNLVHAG